MDNFETVLDLNLISWAYDVRETQQNLNTISRHLLRISTRLDSWQQSWTLVVETSLPPIHSWHIPHPKFHKESRSAFPPPPQLNIEIVSWLNIINNRHQNDCRIVLKGGHGNYCTYFFLLFSSKTKVIAVKKYENYFAFPWLHVGRGEQRHFIHSWWRYFFFFLS